MEQLQRPFSERPARALLPPVTQASYFPDGHRDGYCGSSHLFCGCSASSLGVLFFYTKREYYAAVGCVTACPRPSLGRCRSPWPSHVVTLAMSAECLYDLRGTLQDSVTAGHASIVRRCNAQGEASVISAHQKHTGRHLTQNNLDS